MTSTPDQPQFAFDNTFARELDGFFVPWEATKVPKPKLLAFNDDLARDLGLEGLGTDKAIAADFLSGNVVPEGASPLVQAYAGHQFGGFSPQLGDGRALLLGEVLDQSGQRRDIQLKGSGRSPFSRGGDGKAPLGPVLREYLIAEAMHALGIPTTRALAAVATGEDVIRETALPGAVLTRVAASHVRVGTFQFFAARREVDQVRKLADYVIARHYPEVAGSERPYLALFEAVLDAQASLVAHWMLVGFVHGVMNTDNTTISGETIDYGPCAFMDRFAPQTVFSSIDTQGRYSYARQPLMAQWNLARFAEALLDIIGEDPETAVGLLTAALESFPEKHAAYWLDGMRAKLGLVTTQDDDLDLANGLLAVMEQKGADYTQVFRNMSDAVDGDGTTVRAHFEATDAFDGWFARWQARLGNDGAMLPEGRKRSMNAVNPIYIPRNHKVEEALQAAVARGDMKPFERLLDVVSAPFTARDDCQDYALPAPKDAGMYRTFCGT